MRIEKDGKFFRMRRGKLVEIPAEWVGKVTTSQTRKGRTKEARHFGTGAATIPTRHEVPATGQDARPFQDKKPQPRRMMPEPKVARQAAAKDAIEDSDG